MKLERYFILGAMLGTSCLLSAQQPAEKPKAAEKAEPPQSVEQTTSSKIGGIIAEQTALHDKLVAEMRKIRDRKEAMDYYQKNRVNTVPMTLEILELAKADPKAPAVVKGLNWGLQSYNAEQFSEAMDIIIANHINNPDIKFVSSKLASMGPRGEAYLKSLMLYSNNADVRQTAMLNLASVYSRQEEKKAEGIALYKKLLSWPGLKESKPRYYESAKGAVFVAENLSVGAVAPDIVGTDQDDVEFKLSDYRGQVVLLDFWGIW